MCCAECDFDWGIGADALIALIASFESAFEHHLEPHIRGMGSGLMRIRPRPHIWSALEYVAHTRDAIAFYVERINLILEQDRPQLAPRDFDRLAEDYSITDAPAAVAAELGRGAGAAATLLSTLTRPQWNRVGVGSAGDERTVLELARRLAHEGQHHLLDVDRVLRDLG